MKEVLFTILGLIIVFVGISYIAHGTSEQCPQCKARLTTGVGPDQKFCNVCGYVCVGDTEYCPE